MKVYYFTVIAVGLMFTLFLAGIDTTSSQVISFVGGTSPESWRTSLLWIAAIAAFAAFATTSRVSVGGTSYQASVEFVVAGFVTATYAIFASDMYSIVSKMYSLTCPEIGGILACSWEYWVVWAIIIPIMAGYTISLISYIRGSD